MATGVASPYLRQHLLDDYNGVASFTKPATIWLALTTSVIPAASNTIPPGVEVTWTGYARKQITMSNASWTSADSSGKCTNKVDLPFPTITANATSAAVGWVLVDASSGGNVLESGALDSSIQPFQGQIPTVPVGTLVRAIL